MFVFRTRRANLTKRLWKARKRRGGGGGGVGGNGALEDDSNVAALLKKLQENQLEMLWKAVDSRGQDLANCVLLPRDCQPHVLCCQTWRWPDLAPLHATELRRLPVCRSACDPVYICCNPYHWSRIYQPDSPPPPYSRCLLEERLKPEDPGSLTTNGEDSNRNPQEWCKVAYWELAQRVGPLFPVEVTAVNIFGDIPYGDGLSLSTLAHYHANPPESVRNTRRKIGLGVTLSLEDDHIWLYNRSDSPIFVNSLTLENAVNSPLPTRVPAEQCLCVYDPVKAAHLHYGWNLTSSRDGPVDTNSIRISFAKGWGPKYSRQEITSCPCWLEILLAPCR